MDKRRMPRIVLFFFVLSLLLSFYSTVSAEIDGVPAIIDPTVATSDKLPTTPVDMDQGMDMPKGLFVISSLDSSAYGIAKGNDDSIYWTEYSGNSIKKVTKDSLGNISLFSNVESITASTSQLFGIVMDSEGNIFYGKDGDLNDGAVYRRTPAGVTTTILSGISRPRQIAVDAWGNAYTFIAEFIFYSCCDSSTSPCSTDQGFTAPAFPDSHLLKGITI